MNGCLTCNVCDRPGTLGDSAEVADVPCNIRKFQNERFTVWRCKNCNSLHCKDSVELDRYYAGYYLQNQRLDYFTRCNFGNRLRLLKKVGVRKTDRILDYGCSAGAFGKYLRQRGYRSVFGFDPYVAEFADKSVLEQKYDCVTSYEVIEHADEPRAFMQEVSGCLAPKGVLAISTPNAVGIDLSQPETPELHQPYHRHMLSEDALVTMGRQLGLAADYVYRRFFLDTLFPAVNTRFVWEYMRKHGNVFDVLTEPAKVGSVLASPRLVFYAVAGYFFPTRQSMMVLFRKS